VRRREFITLIGGAAAWPVAARAQQPAMPVVGWLNLGSPESTASDKAGFLQGLKETGYIEDQNLTIEDHFADFRNERLSALAADLVRHRVNVIAAIGGPASVLAAKAATTTIQSSLRLAATRSSWVSSPASTGRAGMSPE
jgi:putative ABC transport system substrate-binding protein